MIPLSFYIIITPNSLRFLKFALWSLQRRVDINIVLVSNGLANNEYQEMMSFCEQIQCEYIDLKSSSVLSHGRSLDLLIEQHDDEWFCFCDSDILSINPHARDIIADKNFKAMSSCEAMFWNDKEVKGVLGRCNRWPDGSKNLTSFFGIYEFKTIKYIIQKYDIGFNNIHFNEIKSAGLRELLQHKGINESSRKLDTGKALTVALELENHTFKHEEIDSLLHVGGMSSWMLNGDQNLINKEYHLTDSELYQIATVDSWLYNLNSHKDTNNKNFYLRRQQRLAAARYCFQLISHYVDYTPMPVFELSDDRLITKIERVHQSIQQYYSEFS